MDKARLMRRRQAARDFAQQAGLLLESELCRESIQRKALYEFHHDGRWIGFIHNGEDRHHRRIGQRRRFAGFLQNALAQSFLRAAA